MFSLPIKFNNKGKLEVSISNIPKLGSFRKNDFPYNLPEGTQHYIMWYTYLIDDDYKINQDIYDSIFQLLGTENFEFIWYKNPKMTIPEIYHLQVFWRIIT